MDKIIILLLLSVIGSVTKGNAQLQCHVCTNCPNPNELDSNMIQQCSLQTTTTTTTTTATTTTTTPPEDTTTTPPEETTTNPPADTTAPDGPIITTLPPTVTPPDDTTPDGGPIITTQPPPITPPSTTPQVPVSPPDILRQKLLHVVRQTLSGFECFVVRRTVGDSVQINRGCVVARENDEQTCADANGGEEPQFCQLCTSDGCNDMDASVGSKYAAVSLAILLSSLFVTFTIR